MLLQALQAVVAGEPTTLPIADVAEWQVDLVVDHDDPVERHLELAACWTGRAARFVHIRLGQQHRDARPSDAGTALAQEAREDLPRLREVPARGELVRNLESDVVPCAGVLRARVAQTDDEEVDRSRRPGAPAKQAHVVLTSFFAAALALGGLATALALARSFLALGSLGLLADELGL